MATTVPAFTGTVDPKQASTVGAPDARRLDIDDAASRIRKSAISRELLGEMDEWILARGKTGGDRQELARVVQLADTDEWRNELRQAWMRGDGETVRNLAKSRDPEKLLHVDAHVLTSALPCDRS